MDKCVNKKEGKRYVDFAKPKERVSIIKVVERYGWALEDKGGDLVGDCPLCADGGGGTTTFRVSQEKGVFKCFSCGAGGNVLELVGVVEGITLPKSAVLIADWFEITDLEYTRPRKSRKQTAEV